MSVQELRLVVTVENFDEALNFYRDRLGLREVPAVQSPGGRVAILDAGRATLEIADAASASFIDEVEVGRRVAGPIRVAFNVSDVIRTTDTLAEAGATVVAAPRQTPFHSINARLNAPAGLHLTIFEKTTTSDETAVD
jgi:methylmalonyl-CoA/ethylmalonyl-CoA epimerase